MSNIAPYVYLKFRVLLFKISIKLKRDRQRMYNVTTKYVRVTIVAVEKQ